MTRVKICGITREEDLAVAVAAGADAVGFVVDVSVDSPREITADNAADLVSGLPPFVTSVLVTMPDTVQDAIALQRTVGADVIQVHGTLAPEHVGGLGRRIAADVIVAVDTENAAAYADPADALLVDSLDEDGGGGTGEIHDWTASRALADDLDVPVILAGGLTPSNVAEAIDTVDPDAVDTSSGVEREGGIKDAQAVQEFVAASRGVAA